MKKIFLILSLFLFSFCVLAQSKFPASKVVISEQFRDYKSFSNYVKFDNLLTLGKERVYVTKINESEIKIVNISNSGSSGFKVIFDIDSNLHIIDVIYDTWWDVIDGSQEKYTVENVIMCLNKNPFENNYLQGHYTLKIKTEYIAGDLLEKEGKKDYVYYEVFNGSFKIFTPYEREKGIDWINNQHEIEFGIKDSTGIYYEYDLKPEFLLGDSTLHKILNDFTFLKSEIEDSTYHSSVGVSFIIDENGFVDRDKIEIKDEMLSKEVLERLKKYDILWDNWKPAIYKYKNVKTKLNISIRVVD